MENNPILVFATQSYDGEVVLVILYWNFPHCFVSNLLILNYAGLLLCEVDILFEFVKPLIFQTHNKDKRKSKAQFVKCYLSYCMEIMCHFLHWNTTVFVTEYFKWIS